MEETFRIIYNKSLNNEVLNDSDIFKILELTCDGMDLQDFVLKNYFVRDTSYVSIYNDYNKSVLFNINLMIEYAVESSSYYNFNSIFEKYYYINTMIVYFVLFRLYSIDELRTAKDFFRIFNKSKEELIENNKYDAYLRKLNPTYRYAKVNSLYLIREFLSFKHNDNISNIIDDETINTIIYGYYRDYSYFPLNAFCTQANIAIPSVPKELDKVVIGDIVDEDLIENYKSHLSKNTKILRK